jgi:hypothetical protein
LYKKDYKIKILKEGKTKERVYNEERKKKKVGERIYTKE